MRKILSIVVLSLFLNAQTSQAFLPVAIPAWYYGAGALAVGGGAGVYCAMKSGYVATIDVAGDLRRKAGVAWVALSTASLPVLFEKNVSAKKTFAQVSDTIASKPTTYPNLKNASYLTAAPPSNSKTQTGAIVNVPVRGVKLITSTLDDVVYGQQFDAGTIATNYTNCTVYYGSLRSDGGVPRHIIYFSPTANATFTPRAATLPEFVSSVSSNGTSGDAAALYQAELDHMMQDETYVPTFTDETTGLPLAFPSFPLSPAALAAINAQGVASDEREKALTAAQQAATSAVAAKDAAVSAANADPTNTALAQKAADATAAAAAATAAAQKVAAENATTDAAEAKKEVEETYSPVTVPGLKTFSWARLADLRGLLATTFPFNLLDRVSVIVGAFVREPVAPSFTLPMYGGNELSFNLSMFDGIATFFRWAFASIMTIGIIHRIVVFYRGA